MTPFNQNLTGFRLSEPDIVGFCWACGGEIYDYELTTCSICGFDVHVGCIKKCENPDCNEEGCNNCMIEKDGYVFCCEDCIDVKT